MTPEGEIMSTKPILFSTPMVQAILDGRKTMTRRVIKPQPVRNGAFWELGGAGWSGNTVTPVYGHSLYNRIPHKPGDVLWVRETWYLETHYDAHSYVYRASSPDYPVDVGVGQHGWRPSIFMPREAARLFLRVKGVRVERLQNISAEDCEAEGHFETAPVEPRPRSWFSEVWDSLNAKRGYGWDSNPWVWVYSFERVDKPAGWPGGEGK